MGPGLGLRARSLGVVRGRTGPMAWGGKRLEAIGRLVDAGRLRPQVEAVLPFDQVREALERVADRHRRGKVVLQIG